MKDGAELKSLQAQDIPELMAQSANLLQILQTIVTRLDTLLAGVEAGKGNIGKLLKDEDTIDHNVVGRCLLAERSAAVVASKFAPFPGRTSPRRLMRALDGSLARSHGDVRVKGLVSAVGHVQNSCPGSGIHGPSPFP